MPTPLEVIDNIGIKYEPDMKNKTAGDRILTEHDIKISIHDADLLVKQQTKALLTALVEDAEVRKGKVWTEIEFSNLPLEEMYKAHGDVTRNNAIQTYQDRLLELMKAI